MPHRPVGFLEERGAEQEFGHGRSICSSNTCGQNQKRGVLLDEEVDDDGDSQSELAPRLVTFEEEENNKTLSTQSELLKRAFPDYTDKYLIDITENKGGRRMTPLIPDSSTSTSVFQQLGNTKVNIGTNGLCGCTCLFLVSDTAVYAAHYYENLAFDSGSRGFNRQVERFLENTGDWEAGEDGNKYPGLAKVKGHFKNENTKAYIMTPAKDTAGPNNAATFDTSVGEYEVPKGRRKAYIQELKNVVNKIMPGLQPEVHRYKPADCDDEDTLVYTISGRALFQFDPTDSKKTRLFFENKQVK